jgi:hypothetical protein
LGIKPKYTQCKTPEWSKENIEAYSWCINHGVLISAVATGPGMYIKSWYIQVVAKGKTIMSPKTYGPDEIYSKILELYMFYYKQNTNKNG